MRKLNEFHQRTERNVNVMPSSRASERATDVASELLLRGKSATNRIHLPNLVSFLKSARARVCVFLHVVGGEDTSSSQTSLTESLQQQNRVLGDLTTNW